MSKPERSVRITPKSTKYDKQKKKVIKVTSWLVLLHIGLAITVAALIPPQMKVTNFLIVTAVLLLSILVVFSGVRSYRSITSKEDKDI